MVSARGELERWSLGRLLSPLHEVKIRVLKGLTKHPRGVPNRSISSQKNWISSKATVEDMSSM